VKVESSRLKVEGCESSNSRQVVKTTLVRE